MPARLSPGMCCCVIDGEQTPEASARRRMALPSLLCPRRAWCWATGQAFLSVCRCEWICVACFSLWIPVSECNSMCLCIFGASAEASHLGLGTQRPQLGLGMEGQDQATCPPIYHLLTDNFLLQNNAQRLGASQSTHSLTTPVVSVATPSLLSQGLPFSSMPTTYNTGECSGGLSCVHMALGREGPERGHEISSGDTLIRGRPLIWESPT